MIVQMDGNDDVEVVVKRGDVVFYYWVCVFCDAQGISMKALTEHRDQCHRDPMYQGKSQRAQFRSS